MTDIKLVDMMIETLLIIGSIVAIGMAVIAAIEDASKKIIAAIEGKDAK